MNREIEELARELCEIQYKGMKCSVCDTGCDCRMLAEALYNAGYRKASEGEWIKGITGYTCSACYKQEATNRYTFCPNCGAQMKGEAR